MSVFVFVTVMTSFLCEAFPYFLVLLMQKEQQGVYASFCSFVFLYFPCLNYTFL